jgi:hypothetical protein
MFMFNISYILSFFLLLSLPFSNVLAVTSAPNACAITKPIQANQWTQIGIPCEAPAGQNTIATIFGNDLSGIYDTDWVLFSYNPINNTYEKPALSDSVEVGKGYWVISFNQSATLNMPLGSQPVNTQNSSQCLYATGCYETTLVVNQGETQYQMLSSPSDVSISGETLRINNGLETGLTLEESQTANILANHFWSYNETTNEYDEIQNQIISPWTGFWAATLPTASNNPAPKLLFPSPLSKEQVPKLNFSDLISGPDTGLGDGLGNGVVVTIWGQGLGSTQDSSTITFTDSSGTSTSPAHVYYWKNADGKLPGGPANLYASHKIQEVAFSIPDMASGTGTIKVTVNNQTSNTLPFTIRTGSIYHVKPSGNDSTGNGTFSTPWKTINKAFNSIANPGSTIYIHDSLVTTDFSKKTGAVYWNDTAAFSGLSNQYGVIAFPNSQPSATGLSGISNYKTAGQVVSKFSVFASECDEDANHQPVNCDPIAQNLSIGIQSSAYGRAVGNAITDRPGGCVDSQQGAISGGAINGQDRVSGYQILGNEVYDYGCEGTSKFHHTTYLSIRSADHNLQVDPWRFGWNYLHGNHAKNGIHMFDENFNGPTCGSPNGTVFINDNVIIDQGGAGINVGVNCPWTNDFDIYNNVLINVGLAAAWDAVDPGTSDGPNSTGIAVDDDGLSGTFNIFNNTVIGWNNHDNNVQATGCIGLKGVGDNVTVVYTNNVCVTDKDKRFLAFGYNSSALTDNISGSNNAYYYSGTGSPILAIKPDFDVAAIITNPLMTILGSQLNIAVGSPIIGLSNSGVVHDIYGVTRLSSGELGAVESLFVGGGIQNR